MGVMTGDARVVALRLEHQQLARQDFSDPAAVVSWLGAVQAQDHAGGKWAIGLRARGATDAAIERAIAARTIIRTWPMRSTLHFVAAADIRWMLELLAPRMIARAAGRYRELGLDAASFARAERALTAALRGGNRLARKDCMAVLARAGCDPAGQRGIHVLGHLSQRGVLCLAAHIGKQPAFALLEEWVPMARPLAREAALAELARRYFTSHGPATAADFAWWSGLTLAVARTALELAGPTLAADDRGRISPRGGASPRAPSPRAHLLPPWDVYTVAYKDRSQLLAARHQGQAPRLLRPTVIIAGQAVATWTRTLTRTGATVHLAPFARLNTAEQRAIKGAAERYGQFLGGAVVVD
jgi:Winged helix DNA-binding domain